MNETTKGNPMGHVILPSGSTVWVDDLSGSINLSQLVQDIKCEDFTPQFRINCISATGKLGKNATQVIPHLREVIGATKDNLLSDAATQAIKKIEEGGTVGVNGRSAARFNGCNHHPHVQNKKLKVYTVTFEEVESGENLDDGLSRHRICNFCDKMVHVNKYHGEFSDRLGGKEKFFCNFCLRNDYHLRSNSNVLALTYRGLIGYYYYSYYVVPKNSSMYVSDVQDYVELHIKVGLQNPLFRYDPETFCWFVDFSKVGKTKRKMSVESVLRTIVQQISCFNLYENVRESSPRKLFDKYKNVVMQFSQNRTRHDKVFAPTLWGCDIPESGSKAIPVDILKNFMPAHLSADINRNKRPGV